MDPILFTRLAQIRQQEILAEAAQRREPRVTIIQWSRLFEPIVAFFQRRSRRLNTQSQISCTSALDQIAACE